MIAIYYIATGPYTRLMDGFLKSVNRFMPNEQKVVCVIADQEPTDTYGLNIEYHHTEHYPWPVVAMYKFYLMQKYKVDGARLHFYFNANIEFTEQCDSFDYGCFNDSIVLSQHAAWDAQRKDYAQSGAIGIPDNLFDTFCDEHVRRVNDYMQRKQVVPKWHDETVLNEMLLRDKVFPSRFFPVERDVRFMACNKSNNPSQGLCMLNFARFKMYFKQ